MKGKKALSCILAAALVGSSFTPWSVTGTLETQAADEDATVIDVTDFGADPGGAKDSAKAIIAALDEAAEIQKENPKRGDCH